MEGFQGRVWDLLGVSSSPRVGLRERMFGICWFWGLVWKDFGAVAALGCGGLAVESGV